MLGAPSTPPLHTRCAGAVHESVGMENEMVWAFLELLPHVPVLFFYPGSMVLDAYGWRAMLRTGVRGIAFVDGCIPVCVETLDGQGTRLTFLTTQSCEGLPGVLALVNALRTSRALCPSGRVRFYRESVRDGASPVLACLATMVLPSGRALHDTDVDRMWHMLRGAVLGRRVSSMQAGLSVSKAWGADVRRIHCGAGPVAQHAGPYRSALRAAGIGTPRDGRRER